MILEVFKEWSVLLETLGVVAVFIGLSNRRVALDDADHRAAITEHRAARETHKAEIAPALKIIEAHKVVIK